MLTKKKKIHKDHIFYKRMKAFWDELKRIRSWNECNKPTHYTLNTHEKETILINNKPSSRIRDLLMRNASLRCFHNHRTIKDAILIQQKFLHCIMELTSECWFRKSDWTKMQCWLLRIVEKRIYTDNNIWVCKWTKDPIVISKTKRYYHNEFGIIANKDD